MPDRTEMLARARSMRREPTPAERVLWRVLHDRKLAGLKFRRQVQLGRYIVDFACFSPRVVIECDGGQHADNPYDEARDAWLRSQGFKVLRFWNNDIVERASDVADSILREVGRG